MFFREQKTEAIGREAFTSFWRAMRFLPPLPPAALPPFLPISRMTSDIGSRLITPSYEEICQSCQSALLRVLGSILPHSAVAQAKERWEAKQERKKKHATKLRKLALRARTPAGEEP
jgi:hypothetical protein